MMNTVVFVRCSKNDVRVRSMFDKMVFDSSLLTSNNLFSNSIGKWESVSCLFTFSFVYRSWTIEGATIAFVPVAFVVQIQIPPGLLWLLQAKLWWATPISCHSSSNHLPVPVSCNKSVYLWRVHKNVLRCCRQSRAAQV